MSKTSALDRAIANLTQQIDALQIALAVLVEQRQPVGKKPAKPRVLPREEKSAS